MSREYKKYEIKSVKKPTKSKLLLSCVLVIGKDSIAYYCYISFSEHLVEAVGKKLSRGVSKENPAYLSIVWNKEGLEWIVSANYVLGGETKELWRTPYGSPPAWLKFYSIKVKNAYAIKTSKTPVTCDSNTAYAKQRSKTHKDIATSITGESV